MPIDFQEVTEPVFVPMENEKIPFLEGSKTGG